MSDLISRSALLKQLLESKDNGIIKAVIGLVESQPTAYSVEKVVAELEDLQCVNPFLTTTEYEHKAIEIARKGGVE